ncbi:MAG: flagellar hook-length control protein FliK [Treponema sp.]|nr:flagellar hook-length control protein FliK [Treponema sp.]
MIEVSTIEAPHSAGNTPELPRDSSVFGQKARKKDAKPGIFGKLLDRLVNKSGKNQAGSPDPAGKLRGSQFPVTEEGVLAGNGGKSPSSSKKTLFPGIEAWDLTPDAGNVSAFTGQNAGEGPKNQALMFSEETGKPERLSPRRAGKPSLSDYAVVPGDGALIHRGQTEGNSRETDLAVPAGKGDQGLAEFVHEAVSRTPEKESPASADFLPFSAGNTEPGIPDFAGFPGPALADVPEAEKSGQSEDKGPRIRKGRDRFSIDFRDLRTEKTPSASEGLSSDVKTAFGAEKIDVDIPVELRVSGGREGGDSGGFMSKSAFEDALAQQVHENLGSDIVKQASIIVRDRGEGTIRLSLKPETLGNVKIRLEMTENKITGHIVVESSEAFKAFERELPVLEKQFQESGFSETSLEMSFSRDNGSGARYRQDEGEPRFSPVLAASRYDAETERIEVIPQRGSADGTGRTAVNLLI